MFQKHTMTFPEWDLAQAVGIVSFALGILCFYQHNDKRLKIMMVVMNLNHALHFALLGAMTAFASALLAAVRTFVSIKVQSRNIAYFFMGLALIWGLYLSDHWYDMFPIAGSMIGTFALFQLSGIRMRLGFLAGALCWLTNNILVGSIGGTLLETTLILVNLNTMRKLHGMNDKAANDSI